MGFNFHRYWEGDLYLHLKWCMDGLRKKYDWWTGLLEAIFKGWLLSQMIIQQARHGKWMISHLLYAIRILQEDIFINIFLTAVCILEITNPYLSYSKDSFNTISGRRGLEWALLACNLEAENTTTSNDFMFIAKSLPDSLTISVGKKEKTVTLFLKETFHAEFVRMRI